VPRDDPSCLGCSGCNSYEDVSVCYLVLEARLGSSAVAAARLNYAFRRDMGSPSSIAAATMNRLEVVRAAVTKSIPTPKCCSCVTLTHPQPNP